MCLKSLVSRKQRPFAKIPRFLQISTDFYRFLGIFLEFQEACLTWEVRRGRTRPKLRTRMPWRNLPGWAVAVAQINT